jgi:hypothetical protein
VLEFLRRDIDRIAQTIDWRWLASYPANKQHNQANQKHENGDLVDAVHEAQIQVDLLTLEEISGIEIV